jgi:hypothetical protein
LYAKANREEIQAKRRTYYAEHKTEIQARQKLYRDTHKDELNARRAAHYAANRDEILPKRQAYRAEHRDEIRAKRKLAWATRTAIDKEDHWLKHLQQRYGLSQEEYEELKERQKSKCAICGRKQSGKRLSVDHCHSTGLVRGLLCNKCNAALGLLDDYPDRLRCAIRYLENSKKGA